MCGQTKTIFYFLVALYGGVSANLVMARIFAYLILNLFGQSVMPKDGDYHKQK